MPCGISKKSLVPLGINKKSYIPSGISRSPVPLGISQKGFVPSGPNQKSHVPQRISEKSLLGSGLSQKSFIPSRIGKKSRVPLGISLDYVLPHMKISKTVEMKHFMVYRYLILRHPDQNERYLKLRTIYPHGQAEILFGVRIILANGNGCKKESETSFRGTGGGWDARRARDEQTPRRSLTRGRNSKVSQNRRPHNRSGSTGCRRSRIRYI